MAAALPLPDEPGASAPPLVAADAAPLAAAADEAVPRGAAAFVSSVAHGRPLSMIESSASSDDEEDEVAVPQRSAVEQERIRARAPARRTLDELRIEVHALYAREASQGAAVPLGELPRLLAAFNAQMRRPLASPAIVRQIETYAEQQPDLGVSEEAFVSMLTALHDAGPGSDSEGDLSLDLLVAGRAGAKPVGEDSLDEDTSQGEDSMDISSSSDEEVRAWRSRAISSSPPGTALAVRKRGSEAFPRSQDQPDDHDAPTPRLPSHRRKTATSDPAEPSSRSAPAGDERRVLSGKGKANNPPSAYSFTRPRPTALARPRRTSDVSADVAETVHGDVDDETPSTPNVRRRMPSHPQPEMPRSVSTGSVTSRQFPRATSPPNWDEDVARTQFAPLSPGLMSPPLIRQAEPDADRLQSKIKTLEQQHRVSSQQWIEERENLHEDYARVSAELEDAKQSVASLQKDLVRAREQKEHAERRTEDRDLDIQARAAEAEQMRARKVEWEKERKELLARATSSEADLVERQRELSEAQGKVAKQAQSAAEAERERKTLAEKTSQLQSEISRLETELRQAGIELGELQARERRLEEQIASLNEQMPAMRTASGFTQGRHLEAELAGEVSFDNSVQSIDVGETSVGDTSGEASFIETTTVRRHVKRSPRAAAATEFAETSTQTELAAVQASAQTDEASPAEAPKKDEAAAAESSAQTEQSTTVDLPMPPSYREAELERAVIARDHPAVPLHERKLGDSAALLLESVFHTSETRRYHALRDGVGRRCLVLESAIQAREDEAQLRPTRERSPRASATLSRIAGDKHTAPLLACSLGFLTGAVVMGYFFSGPRYVLGSFALEDAASWQISNGLAAAMLDLGVPLSTGSGAGEWWLPRLLYGSANVVRRHQPV